MYRLAKEVRDNEQTASAKLGYLQWKSAWWVREFERNQLVVALAHWRLMCVYQRRVEKHEVYRKQGAASRLSELMKRLQLRLMRKIVRKYLVKIGWIIYHLSRDNSKIGFHPTCSRLGKN